MANLHWRFSGKMFRAASYGAVSQIDDHSPCNLQVVLPTNNSPGRDGSNNQHARGDREYHSRSTTTIVLSNLRQISIAWTARTEVIEPFLRFRERHRSRRDSLENVRPRTPAPLRIWKLFEQTSAQRIQDALFVSRGISLFVQASLSL